VWENFEQRSTLNGRIAHEIDRLENLIQLCLYVTQGHSISDRLIALFSTWPQGPSNTPQTLREASRKISAPQCPPPRGWVVSASCG